jgi:hypothetical protein
MKNNANANAANFTATLTRGFMWGNENRDKKRDATSA